MEKPTVPEDFIKHTQEKIEKGQDLSIPISEHELITECEGDELCERALNDFFDYSVRYAADVWEMKMLFAEKNKYSTEEWQDIYGKADRARSQLHDTLIDSIAILIRQMNRAERDTDWARELMPAGKLERAYCGKFAIMLTYSRYVNDIE